MTTASASAAVKPRRAAVDIDTSVRMRLVGTKGPFAAVGHAVAVQDGSVCWRLDPAYGAWLWPLMHKLTELVLSVPEAQVEPAEDGDCATPPRAPSEAEKDEILKLPELAHDGVRVFALTIKGKPRSVHKAFPTRTANLGALRYFSKRARSHP